MLKYPGLSHVIALLSMVELLRLHLLNFANDPGVGWHLKTGELIVKEKTIPYYDPFLAFDTLRPWICDQWLADIIFFQLYSLGEWWPIYGLLSACFYLSFFGFLFETCRERTGSALAASIAALVAFKIAAVHFILRPVVFGIFAFAACQYLLRNYERNVRKLSYNVFLFVLFAVWVNLHGTYTLGLVLVATAAGSPTLQALGQSQFQKSIAFCIPVVFSFLGTLMNPWGVYIYESLFSLTRSDFFLSLNEEWLPLDYSSYGGAVFLSIIALIVFSVALQRKRPGNWIELTCLALFGYLAHSMVRMLPYFAIVSAPIIASTLMQISASRFWNRSLPFRELKQAVKKLADWENKAFPLVALSIGICLFILLSSFTRTIPFYSGEPGPQKGIFPYEAVKYLRSHNARIVFAPPRWGGFLVWQADGTIKPIIDDRNQLLGEDIYRELLLALKTPEGVLSMARRYRAQFILLPAEWKIAQKLQQIQPATFSSGTSLVFLVSPGGA